MSLALGAVASAKTDYLQAIVDLEVEQLINISIQHSVLPLIAGISMDLVSEEDYKKMGGVGTKPKPLSPEKKLSLYKKMHEFLKQKLFQKCVELVKSVAKDSLGLLSEEEIKLKAEQKSKMEAVPDWSKLPLLFADHVYLFKEFKAKSNLKIDQKIFHDALCPIIKKYCDSGEIFECIRELI